MIEDARRFRFDDESMAELAEALRDPDMPESFTGVWPDHVGTVIAFLAVATQWRAVPAGGAGAVSAVGGMVKPIVPRWIGLDYAAVKIALDIEGIEVTRQLWWGLRVMEDAAAAELNKAE